MNPADIIKDDPAAELSLLKAGEIVRVYEIWNRLAEFDATRAEDAVLYLLRALKEITGSDDAVWLGVLRLRHGREASRDHQKGWRTRVVMHLEWTDLKRDIVAEAMKAQEQDGGIPSSIEMAKLAGRYRTLFLRELHDLKSFSKTHHYRACFIPFNITDRLWCVFPVNTDCEVAVILDRCGAHPRFNEHDRALVSVIMRGLKWFHQQMLIAHGVTLANHRLTPREKSLLSQLLSDKTEKEIAEHLDLTFATVRSYTKSLYAKFGVRGRAGLMALWLGGA